MFDNLNYYRVFYTVANTGNISQGAVYQPACDLKGDLQA